MVQPEELVVSADHAIMGLAERLCRFEAQMALCILKHFTGIEMTYMVQTMR
jgi:hypothetical protein